MAKDKGGRPTVFTEETLDKLKEAFLMDATIKQACFYAGIHETTYHDWKRDNKSRSSQLEAFRDDIKLKAKKVLAKEIEEGNGASSKWLLERREKENYSLRQELTGEDGEALRVDWNLTRTYEADEEADKST